MALYTETLSDWLANGWTLPTVFALMPEIDGTSFSDIFTDHYSEWEIGFETESLFKKKLDVRAKIVIPHYQPLLTQRLSQLSNLFNSQKSTSRVRKNYFNNLVVTNLADGTQNSGDTDVFTESGATDNELADVILRYQNELQNLLEKILDEFKSCFMGLC